MKPRDQYHDHWSVDLCLVIVGLRTSNTYWLDDFCKGAYPVAIMCKIWVISKRDRWLLMCHFSYSGHSSSFQVICRSHTWGIACWSCIRCLPRSGNQQSNEAITKVFLFGTPEPGVLVGSSQYAVELKFCGSSSLMQHFFSLLFQNSYSHYVLSDMIHDFSVWKY